MLWAVSHIDWFDNDLITEFHEGATWKEALAKHSKMQGPNMQEYVAEMPDDVAVAKKYAFDCDSMIEVVPVPKEG